MKTALITGASSGFGRAMAYKFARNGWQLILLARRTDRLEAIKKELSSTPVHIASVDMTDQDAIAAFAENIPASFKKIDLLVNNAGLALGLEMADKTNLDEWNSMIDTNIKGLVTMTRYILPGMVENNSGHIINLGSIAGKWPYPGSNVYGATKAFVDQFSLNLRADLLETAVRVTNLAPGMAESEFSVVRFSGDKSKADSVYKGAKPLTPEDIAESAFWIASLPEHVNVNSIEIMPNCQAWGALAVHKTS